jgi:IMP cyclohydrolase
LDIYQTAETHFDRHLRLNPYPGRGLIVGRSSGDDAWLMVYWIMGRSAHSRNRRFVAQGPVLRTELVDPDLVADPSLIIYEAMLESDGMYWVSNGDQTHTLCQAMQQGKTFEAALATREREPDPPNYTPRISAIIDLRQPTAQVALNILKANPVDPALTDHFTYRPAPPPPGLGLCLTTYMGDGNPLPSFRGEPLYVPCQGNAQAILDSYWAALNADNRISIAVKRIPFDSSPSTIVLYNRFQDKHRK